MEEQEQDAPPSPVARTTFTFGKQGLVLHSQAREIVANVIDFMKTEAEHFRRYNKPLIPMTNFRERILAATKITTKTYTSVTKEAKDVAEGVSTSFASPRRKRTRTEKKEHESHTTEKQLPTLADADINIRNEYTHHEEEPNVDEHKNVCIEKVFINEENYEIDPEPNFVKTELENSRFFDISSDTHLYGGNHSKKYSNHPINESCLNTKIENIEHEETLDTISDQENYWMKEEIKEKIEIEEYNLLGQLS